MASREAEVAGAHRDSSPALPVSTRARVLIYIGALALFIGIGAPYNGLVDLPISFVLKNKLHLAAHQVADFRLIASIPLYLGFVFGFARDRWDLFGRKDRGMLVSFGLLCALTYAGFAFAPSGYAMLMAAVILSSIGFLFAQAAQQGLASTIGQQHVMSGQISTIWTIFLSVPYLASYLLGGTLSNQLEGRNADQAARALFLAGAVMMALVAGVGALRPRAVFDNLAREPNASTPLLDLKRLAKHWPIYPALTAWFLWSFAPGSGTPLQYYLQNTMHATDAQWGEWNAIFAASFIPTYILYGVLCPRVSAKKLLFWGTVVAVPQMVPLYFIHSVNQALLAAVAIGLMGGVATAAYTDLIIRSCPKGLQGVTVMMAASLYWVAIRFGDLLGTNLYDHFGGFGVCVIAITGVYASILLVLQVVPESLIATADGEARPPSSDETAEALAEPA